MSFLLGLKAHKPTATPTYQPSALSLLISSTSLPDESRARSGGGGGGAGGQHDREDRDKDKEDHLYALALTVQHNLRHQHDWTELQIHTRSTVSLSLSSSSSSSSSPPPLPSLAPSSSDSPSSVDLPRPLVSGMPPTRVYLHPDDQADMLMAESARGKESAAAGSREPPPEREWVLPTRLSEKWSLRRFAEVFDAIDEEPPPPPSPPPPLPSSSSSSPFPGPSSGPVPGPGPGPGPDTGPALRSSSTEQLPPSPAKPRRGGKRVLLATVGEDSTVAYYVVHDGLVKPRQN